MANTFLTAEQIAPLAAALLSRSIVLPATVMRIPAGAYDGPSGGTVTLRIPAPRTALEQVTGGSPITFVDVDETAVNVVVKHLYDAALITDEQLRLTLEDFARQVLKPQATAIGVAAEDQIAAVLNAEVADASFALTADPTDTEDQILAARQALTDLEVPLDGRTLAVSPPIATRLLKLDKVSRVDASGSASALRAAMIGELYGFRVVETPALTAGTAVAYHSSAIAWGNAAPATETDGADSEVATVDGVAMRYLKSFQTDRLAIASVLSTFAGATKVEDQRLYKLDTAVS